MSDISCPGPLSAFSPEFLNLVTHFCSRFERTFIPGGLNIQFNNPFDYKTAKLFVAKLETGVKSIMSFPTHCSGQNIMNSLLAMCDSITNTFTGNCNLSDLCTVFLSKNMEKTMMIISFSRKQRSACRAIALEMNFKTVYF